MDPGLRRGDGYPFDSHTVFGFSSRTLYTRTHLSPLSRLRERVGVRVPSAKERCRLLPHTRQTPPFNTTSRKDAKPQSGVISCEYGDSLHNPYFMPRSK
jgi:hypothetical protein